MIENAIGSPYPLHSKTRVTNAGKSIAKNIASTEDWNVFENWRNSHSYILNKFRSTLSRNIDERKKKRILVVQRLKRLNTIVDKLKTGRAKDLATMHDLAGCRIIFKTLKELDEYRNRIHKSRFKHVRIDGEKYNYITNPKSTGYRGIHDVFRYNVASESGGKFNGLLIEIQYRTEVQHAWATAVEISDLINKTRVKFDSGADPKRERLFVLASEYLARTQENVKGALADITDEELIEELRELESETHIIRSLRTAHKQKVIVPKSRNIVLHFSSDTLNASGFRSSSLALLKRAELEKDFPQDDVVYVRGSSSDHISSAFRNYFRDAKIFVKLMGAAFRVD